jgi:hypothetical protein
LTPTIQPAPAAFIHLNSNFPFKKTLGKYTNLPSICSLFILLACPVAFVRGAQSDFEKLLSQLSEKPVNPSVLWRIEGQPMDGRTIPALRASFERHDEKKDKQLLAATLLRLGEKSDRYFDFLAGYAITAIGDRTPFFERFDQHGQAVRGQFSAGFESWCTQNSKDPRAVAAIQLGTYLEDVKLLAEVADPRARELFKRGIYSNNPGVVAFSVQGLARLRDLTAIPQISQVVERIPIGERTVVGCQLAWYSEPAADRLFEMLVPNGALRAYTRKNVESAKADELNRTLKRTGRIAPK